MELARQNFLKDYPNLLDWFENQESSTSNLLSSEDQFILGICQCLNLDSDERFAFWTKLFSGFLNLTQNPQDELLNISDFLIRSEFDLQIFASDMSFVAIEIEEGLAYFDLMQLAADKTSLVSFRFLTAWLALNLDLPDKCIQECEKVDSPYAAIFTIQAQALLELGRVKDAIEALNIAVSLDPKEILAYFQLAKSHLALGETDRAWAAGVSCLELSPHNPETSLLLAMIALDAQKIELIEKSWEILSRFLETKNINPTLIITLLDLSFQSKNYSWAKRIVDETDWENLFSDREFIRKLGKVLRGFGELNWMDLAQTVLNQNIDPVGKSG